MKAAKDPKALPKKAAAERTTRARAKPGAASTQDLYTGMSGQFVAMSEFLWRGYNVAVPAVDVGEDIFVVEAEEGILRRVQVKTAGTGTVKGRAKSVRFTLSRTQLNLAMGGSELFFMLLARWDDVDPARHWRFILIRRDQLNELRLNSSAGRRGRPLVADDDAVDELSMNVTFADDDATAWGHSLMEFVDGWPLPDWPIAGPMRARAATAAPTPTLRAARAAAPPSALTVGLGTTPPETAPSGGPPKRP